MAHVVALKKAAVAQKHQANFASGGGDRETDGQDEPRRASSLSRRSTVRDAQQAVLNGRASVRGSVSIDPCAYSAIGFEKIEVVLKESNNIEGLKAILLDKMSILLLAYPLGILSAVLDWGDTPTFWFNFLAIVPLAKIMGDATEELAISLKSDTIGGLLNATFGNAVEMILTACSLKAGLIEVVKSTLLGSVLSNMLLVLGMSFLLGGLVPDANGSIKLKEQNFQVQGALVNMAMLLLACMSFALPTVFVNTGGMAHDDGAVAQQVNLMVSRHCSLLILSSYLAYLVFQLYTHIGLFEDEDGEEQEASSLTPACATGLLFVSTALVSVGSELLVNSIEGVVEQSGIGQQFIGIILLPIIGNACEHASAVRFAIADRPALAIGIAVGSSTQIALLVVPFAVIVGWFIDQPMDLDFHPLNLSVLIISVLIVLSIVSDGRAHWIEGYMLCTAYAIISVLYWNIPDH